MSLQEIWSEATELHQSLAKLMERSRGLGGRTADLSESIAIALEDARKIARDSQKPSRMGVVGAFSAGKTRLVEALLGCAGRLGTLVDERPTSGNVVEFELQVGDVAATQLTDWKVVFMSEAGEAGRMLKRLLLEARNEQNRESSAKLDRLLDEAEFDEGQRPRWIKVQEWAAAAHADARGRQLRTLAFEVYRLAYTVNHAPEWLGKEFRAQEAAALNLMTLSPDRGHYDRPLTDWKTSFPPLPNGGELGAIPANLLRSLFPVVRKIHVQVTLPRFAAEMFGSKDQIDLRLVDCPGAGADESNFRDAVICAFELQDVDAVLVLINGQRPGQNRAFLDDLLRIWGPRAKDRIIAVVSRFDQLPLKNPKDLEVLSQPSSPLTAQELLEAVANFETVYKSALETVIDRDPQRVCLVSVLGQLTVQLIREGGAAQRGTPEFYANEVAYQPIVNDPAKVEAALHELLKSKCLTQMALWGKVGERLAQAGDRASQYLCGILTDFHNDGGFTRLHNILRAHFSRFGEGLLADRLRAQLSKVKDLAQKAETALRALPVPQPQPTTGAPAKAKWSKPEAVHELARRFDVFASAIEGTSHFPLERWSSKKGKAEPVLPAIRRWMVATIYRWEQWKLLLQRIQKAGGRVDIVDRHDPRLAGRPEELHEVMRTPIKSDDFLPPFRETLVEVQGVLRQRCGEALARHGESLKRKLDEQIGAAPLAQMLEVLDEPLKQVLRPIHEGIGSDWLDEAAAESVGADRDATPYDRFFPLQHGPERPGEPVKALYYSWHKPLFTRYPHQFDDRHQHLMYVIKLRQVIVEAALDWLDYYCQTAQAAMKVRIQNQAKRLRKIVKDEFERTPLAKTKAKRGPEE